MGRKNKFTIISFALKGRCFQSAFVISEQHEIYPTGHTGYANFYLRTNGPSTVFIMLFL